MVRVLCSKLNVHSLYVVQIIVIGFSLLLLYSVFWDLYCAAPERRDTCEHSSEAKAFHDYVSNKLLILLPIHFNYYNTLKQMRLGRRKQGVIAAI